jgi:hypothetical protein
MTFINIALSVVFIAILVLIPCGCVLTSHRAKLRTSRPRTKTK